MAKYSYELKLKVVEAYLNHEGGYSMLAKRFGISRRAIIQRWVSSYKEFGESSLRKVRQNQSYSFEFKKKVVESYLTEETSYQDLALR